MSTTLPTTTLEDAVAELNLSMERFTITTTASERTTSDSLASGFHFFKTFRSLGTSAASRSWSLTENVIARVGAMAGQYFPDEETERDNKPSKIGVTSVNKVEVDKTLLPDSISLQDLDSPESLHDGVLSVILGWAQNNLAKIIVDPSSNAYPLKAVERGSSQAPSAQGAGRELFPLTIDTAALADGPNVQDKDRHAHLTRQHAWRDVLLLTAPERDECLSELSVQHASGAAVKKSFQLPNTEVYSDKNLPHASPLMMAPGKRPPKADFVTLLQMAGQTTKHLSPVLLAGEAKTRDTGKARPTGANYRSQLQAALYPSLVLLLLLHTRTSEPGTSLPEDFFIYGIYYDDTKVEIYAHFPFWVTNSDSEDSEESEDSEDSELKAGWRFAQVYVGGFPIARKGDDGPTSALRRVRLATALQAARAHGEQLARHFEAEPYRAEWHVLNAMEFPESLWSRESKDGAPSSEQSKKDASSSEKPKDSKSGKPSGATTKAKK